MATLQCNPCGGTRYDTNHRCEKGCGVMTASAQLITRYEVRSLRERLEQVEAERDALADALEDITQAAQEEGLHMAGWGQQIDKAARALSGNATSLARRDARMKAEALESLASSSLVGDLHKELIRRCAEEYRQQAEADQ